MAITSVAIDRPAEPAADRCIDITDARTDRVESYVAETGGAVHLERRGGRTFLVVDTEPDA
jgi:hypothetical protein